MRFVFSLMFCEIMKIYLCRILKDLMTLDALSTPNSCYRKLRTRDQPEIES